MLAFPESSFTVRTDVVPHCSQTYDTSTKSFENIIFLGSPGIIARLQPGHITTGSVRIRSGRIPSIDWEYARCGAVPGLKSEHMLHCNCSMSPTAWRSRRSVPAKMSPFLTLARLHGRCQREPAVEVGIAPTGRDRALRQCMGHGHQSASGSTSFDLGPGRVGGGLWRFGRTRVRRHGRGRGVASLGRHLLSYPIFG